MPLCEKHSAAEFQSIQKFWLQLDIVSKKRERRKLKMLTEDFFAGTSLTEEGSSACRIILQLAWILDSHWSTAMGYKPISHG